MKKDKCTNRVHMLATPPPTRGRNRCLLPSPLPRHGCMPCREFAKGAECPYRQAYDCDDDVRAVGRELKHCVIERLFRDCSRDELLKGLDLIEEQERARVERLVELLLDAYVYQFRATKWLHVSFNRAPEEGGYAMDDDQFLLGQRYWLAAGERTLRWFKELRPYLDLVSDRRRAAMGHRVPRRRPPAA